MPIAQEEKLPEEMLIPVVENPYIEHISKLRCGSYVTEWTSKAMGYPAESTNESYQSIPIWHDLLRPILPFTILVLLKKQGLEAYVNRLETFIPIEQKIKWLQTELVRKKKPILLLVRATKLHWIVVVGYSNPAGVFYVYDPNSSKTSINPDISLGNNTLDYVRLMNEWEGDFIFKYNAIIIASESKTTTIPSVESIKQLPAEDTNEVPVPATDQITV